MNLATPFGLWLALGVFAAVLSGLYPRWRHWVGVDEAYLWYGGLRVLEGAVPLRDFRSYEPGRYLWCLPFFRLFGKGVLAIRVASGFFFAASLAFLLCVLNSQGMDNLVLGVLLTLFLVTVREPYKLFEPGMACLWLGSGALFVDHPTGPAAFLVGVVVGLAAAFGLNLALYCVGALGVTTAWLWWVSELPSEVFLRLAAGCVAGSAPLWIYSLFVPGFFPALWHRRVTMILSRGTTNLPVPLPWPWKTRWNSTHPQAVLRHWRNGLVFLGLLVLPVLGVGALAWSRCGGREDLVPVLVASISLALFAWHHAFSRADAFHLYQSHVPASTIFVLLLGCVSPGGWLLMPWLLLNLWRLLRLWWRPSPPLTVPYLCDGWRLHGVQAEVRAVEITRRYLADLEGEGRKWLLAVPTSLWLLPLLKVRSPVYDTFCVYPAPESDQRTMIREIEGSPVQLAVIDNSCLDGHPERCFARTHPLVMEWLKDRFSPLPADGFSEHLTLWRRIQSGSIGARG